MFGLNKKPDGSCLTLKIEGMHCSSCAMNIDGELEETSGVLKTDTSYAKAVTKVYYDPDKVDSKIILEAVNRAGYQAKIIDK